MWLAMGQAVASSPAARVETAVGVAAAADHSHCRHSSVCEVPPCCEALDAHTACCAETAGTAHTTRNGVVWPCAGSFHECMYVCVYLASAQCWMRTIRAHVTVFERRLAQRMMAKLLAGAMDKISQRVARSHRRQYTIEHYTRYVCTAGCRKPSHQGNDCDP